jgi:hypothetical protein
MSAWLRPAGDEGQRAGASLGLGLLGSWRYGF